MKSLAGQLSFSLAALLVAILAVNPQGSKVTNADVGAAYADCLNAYINKTSPLTLGTAP